MSTPDLAALTLAPLPTTVVPSDLGPVTLRPAATTEFETLRALHRAAMRPSVTQALGAWDDAQQGERLQRHFDPQVLRFLEHHDTPIGCVVFAQRTPTQDLWCEQFYLDPVWQGHGLGTALLVAMRQTARTLAQPIRLKVLRGSGARRLYERLGFVADGQDAWQDHLTWTPTPPLVIDLAAYGDPDVGVFAGRDRGAAVRTAAELDAALAAGRDLQIVIPAHVFCLTSGFVLGLLGDALRTLGARAFDARVTINGRADVAAAVRQDARLALRFGSPLRIAARRPA